MIQSFSPGAPSAVYNIYPVSSFTQLPEKHSVYCDMATLGGGWTLVQRTVWNFSDSQNLIVDYDDFLKVPYGNPAVSLTAPTAFRLPAQYWEDLYKSPNGTVDNMFKFYLRDEPPTKCSTNAIGEADTVMVSTPLIHGSVGTRWKFTTSLADTGVATGGSAAPFGSSPQYLFNLDGNSGFVALDGSTAGASCIPSQVVPFQYENCCKNCGLWDDVNHVSWEDDHPHPMASKYIVNVADLNGNTKDSLVTMGGCRWAINTDYFAMAAIEYYIR